MLADLLTLLDTTANELQGYIITVIGIVLPLFILYILCEFFSKLIRGVTFTSWAWLDRMTYKPYKGYNRFHSRKWNMQHTADNTGEGYHRMKDGFLIKL